MVTFIGRGRLDPNDAALIDDAARATGLNPADVVVVKGSNVPPDSLSGSTHAGYAGTWDIRVWNLPAAKVEPLVVELRRRNVCAWLRDQEHGGFDPHIHGVRRDSSSLSTAALRQVASYDRGKDGLTNEGEDYHPRPTQRPWPWPTAAQVVRWEGLKNGSVAQNTAVQESLNRLPGDRHSAPVTGKFADTKGPLRRYRIATGSLTMRAALETLSARTGRRWRVG